MSTTSQILERLKIQAREFSVNGDKGLLSVIDEVNTEMMRGDFEHSLQVDSTTGMPPYLVTQDGQYQYDTPADCRKIKSVFFEVALGDSGDAYTRYRKYGTLRQIRWRNIDYWEVIGTSRLRGFGTTAQYTFPYNPGTTSNVYYIAYWVEPSSITGIGVQPDVPSEYHSLLIDGCLARVQPLQYGKINPWLEWKERMRLEFWGDMNYNPPQRNKSPKRF